MDLPVPGCLHCCLLPPLFNPIVSTDCVSRCVRSQDYDYSLDMWSLGCMLAGMIFRKVQQDKAAATCARGCAGWLYTCLNCTVR